MRERTERAESEREEEQEESELPLYGDALDSIVSHVPTLSLLPACHVSPTWRLAVLSSLRRRRPLLLLHLLHPSFTTVAYDPHSLSWSPPLPATWLRPILPRVPRRDPVAVLIGPQKLLVAGGTCELGFPTCDAEVLDLDSGLSDPCDPIPDDFRESSTATWLSVATSDDRVVLLEKTTARFTSLDSRTGTWSRTCDLKPDSTVRLSAIGVFGGRLLLAGLSDSGPVMLKVWEVDFESDWDADPKFREIGRMPGEMAECLAGEEEEGCGFGVSTIGFAGEAGFGYFYNPGDFRGAVTWEIGEGRWKWIGRPKEVDDNPTARIVFGCATVGLDDLKAIFRVRA